MVADRSGYQRTTLTNRERICRGGSPGGDGGNTSGSSWVNVGVEVVIPGVSGIFRVNVVRGREKSQTVWRIGEALSQNICAVLLASWEEKMVEVRKAIRSTGETKILLFGLSA